MKLLQATKRVSPASASTSSPASDLVRQFCVVIALLTSASLTYHGLMRLAGMSYPAATFLFDPAWRFADFTLLQGRCFFPYEGLDPYGPMGYPFSYFPVTAWLFVLLGLLSPAWPLLAYFAVTLAAVLVSAAAAWNAAPEGPAKPWFRLAAVMLPLTSYPLWFAVDRGNVETVLAAAVALGFALLVQGRERAAAFVIGVAGALKLYPLVLVLVLIRRGRWLDAALSCGVFLFSTAMALAAMPTGFVASFDAFVGALHYYSWRHVTNLNPDELAPDHSLFSLVKKGLIAAHAQPWLPTIAKAYTPLVVVGFGALWAFRIRRQSVTATLLLCSIAMVWLPPVSADYTLLNVYPALWLTLCSCATARAASDPALRRTLTGLLIGFAVLVTPQAWRVTGYGVGGQIKAVALGAMFLLLVVRDVGDDEGLRSTPPRTPSPSS